MEPESDTCQRRLPSGADRSLGEVPPFDAHHPAKATRFHQAEVGEQQVYGYRFRNTRIGRGTKARRSTCTRIRCTRAEGCRRPCDRKPGPLFARNSRGTPMKLSRREVMTWLMGTMAGASLVKLLSPEGLLAQAR